MTATSPVSTRAVWQQRVARYWATHPHRCHACGRPVDPDAKTGPLRCEVHHLTYRYPIGQEPDEALIGLCASCHDEERGPRVWRCAVAPWACKRTWHKPGEVCRWAGPSLHSMQRRVSRKHGWMGGRYGMEVLNPDRHYRHLWSYSIRWIRWHRFFGWLTWGALLPPWSAPHRRYR